MTFMRHSWPVPSSAAVTGDLAAFLAARLDEDENRARAAQAEWDSPSVRYEWEDLPDEVFAHARTHDPARVLREVAAKRAILELHHIRRIGTWPVCTHCRPVDPEYTDDLTSEPWPCRTLRALAAVYSDHPGYRQEWAP